MKAFGIFQKMSTFRQISRTQYTYFLMFSFFIEKNPLHFIMHLVLLYLLLSILYKQFGRPKLHWNGVKFQSPFTCTYIEVYIFTNAGAKFTENRKYDENNLPLSNT